MAYGKDFIFKPEDMTLAFIIESAFAHVESGSSAFAFFPFKVLPSFLVPIVLHKEICSFAFQFLVCSVLLIILFSHAGWAVFLVLRDVFHTGA